MKLPWECQTFLSLRIFISEQLFNLCFLLYSVPSQAYKYQAGQDRIIHKWIEKYSGIQFLIRVELAVVAEEAVVLRKLFSHHF